MYDDFVIHLEGLKVGKHKLKFLLDNAFFGALDFSLIEEGKVEIEAILDKKERMIELHVEGKGVVVLTCDRCAEAMNYPLDFTTKTIVKYGEEEFVDEGIWEIPTGDKELNLSHFFYETVCLQLPGRVTHDDSSDGKKCDKEVLKKLEELTVGNKTDNNIDPRWAALNKLK